MKLNRLIPELACSDFARSKDFYVYMIGFKISYERPEDRFAMLEFEGAHLMIEQSNGNWQTGELMQPYGRGINIQIEIDDVDALHHKLVSKGWDIFVPMEDRWYRANEELLGTRQFLIQDPDGYLLRFSQRLGKKPAPG